MDHTPNVLYVFMPASETIASPTTTTITTVTTTTSPDQNQSIEGDSTGNLSVIHTHTKLPK